MARRKASKNGSMLQRINVNTVLGVVLIALITYFILGFFQTEAKAPLFLPGAQFALPAPTTSSSSDSPIRQQLRALQLYMKAVQEGLIVPTLDDVNWLKSLSLFGKNVRLEEPRTPETIAIAIVYERLNEPDLAVEYFSKAVEMLRSETPEEKSSYAAFCFDRLALLQSATNDDEAAAATYRETRQDDKFANRWYGRLIELQMRKKQYHAAKRDCEKCIAELSGKIVPHNCLHSKAMIAAWFGHLEEATRTAISNYDQLLEHSWRRDKDRLPCKGTHYPITYDHFPEEERAAVPGLMARPISIPKSRTSDELCSDQKWPFFLERLSNGEFEKQEAKLIFDEMMCISSDVKTPVLYTLNDVIVKGEGKIISSDKYCAVYSFGYPYQNTRFHPRLEGKDDYNVMELPIIELDEAIALHTLLDQNFYHLTVEGAAMPMLLQFVDEEIWRNSKILLKAHALTANLLEHNRIPVTQLQRYDPEHARYRVKTLHVVDWKFLDTSVYHHPSDYYVPPANVLNIMRRAYTNGNFHPGLNETVARDAVVYIHRDPSSPRSIGNWHTLVDRLNATTRARGLEFLMHTGQESISEQISMFKRALAVVGPHGAGFSNIMFCEQKTAVIELRSEPKDVSEYSRLASAFNLEYWNVPSAQIGRYDFAQQLSHPQISMVVRTLDYVLFDRGQRNVCGEDTFARP